MVLIEVLKELLTLRLKLAFCSYGGYGLGTNSLFIFAIDSSASLIQAMRDFFGSHTYQRKDQSVDQYFHNDWHFGSGEQPVK